ncbi:MAG: hypothetical protein ABW151_01450 [Pseudorhodoplanes sp.]
MNITFLYHGTENLDRVRDWDPETDAMRFPDGIGHGFFQLYLALRNLHPETYISSSPDDADVYVIYKKFKYSFYTNIRIFLRMSLSKKRKRVVSIMSDAPIYRNHFYFVDKSAVPNYSRISKKGDRFIPLLPQNGLIPSAKEESGKKVVAVYGSSQNIPRHILTDEFVDRCAARGIEFRFAELDGKSPEKTLDFSDVDITLCIRGHDELEPGRKPPTKLVNAWVARTVPIIDREPGYLSVGSPGRDCLMLDVDHRQYPSKAQDKLIELIDEASSDALRGAIAERAAEFTKENIIKTYLDFFQVEKASNPTWNYRRMLILSISIFPVRMLLARIDRKISRLYKMTR